MLTRQRKDVQDREDDAGEDMFMIMGDIAVYIGSSKLCSTFERRPVDLDDR